MSKSRKNQLTKAVVLGGSGFIGSWLVKELRKVKPAVKTVSFSSQRVDLTSSRSVARLRKHLDRNTALYLCSAKMKRSGDGVNLLDENLKMVVNVSRVISACDVGHVVFLSSAGIYGEEVENSSINEKTPPNPTSFYALSKYLSEQILAKVVAKESLLILRPPFVYGTNDPSPYTPTDFLRRIKKREEIVLWGRGDEVRDFVYVEDLAKAAVELAILGRAGVYNLVTGKAVSFRDVITTCSRILKVDPIIRTRPRTKKKVDQGFKPGRFKREFPNFKWRNILEGLSETSNSILFL